MTGITVVSEPDLSGKRFSFVLAEDRLGHYPEFRTFFVQQFDLDSTGLSAPGYVQARSGIIYALVFIGRSGDPFPSGVEISAVIDALEPIGSEMLDRDLWDILHWMIDGVGHPWTAEDLDRTGKLYRIPATR